LVAQIEKSQGPTAPTSACQHHEVVFLLLRGVETTSASFCGKGRKSNNFEALQQRCWTVTTGFMTFDGTGRHTASRGESVLSGFYFALSSKPGASPSQAAITGGRRRFASIASRPPFAHRPSPTRNGPSVSDIWQAVRGWACDREPAAAAQQDRDKDIGRVWPAPGQGVYSGIHDDIFKHPDFDSARNGSPGRPMARGEEHRHSRKCILMATTSSQASSFL
jgi:hypothetical protein